MTAEQLIEKAAKAILESEPGTYEWGNLDDYVRDQYMDMARAALAVFEEAHTPTNDERTWVTGFLLGCGVNSERAEEYAGKFLAGFRRSETPTDNERKQEDRRAAARELREVGRSDDEREALVAFLRNAGLLSIYGRLEADEVRELNGLLAGFRRSEVPEPSAEHGCAWGLKPSECAACANERSEAQGEPSSEVPSAGDVRLGFFPNGQCRHHQLADDWAKIWCIRTDDGHTEHETAGGEQWTTDPSDAGWSTDDRRAAEAEAKRRFLEWDGSDDEGVQRFGAGSVSGFILGAEWWKATHHAAPEPQGEPSDAQELLAKADALVESWDRKGSWSSDSPVGMVMRLAAALRRSEVPEAATNRGDIARRVMDHRYAGLCPDAVDGWDRRDPECSACSALDALGAEEPEWEYTRQAEANGWTGPAVYRDEAHASDGLIHGWRVVRRRKAGPWVPVKQEGGSNA